MGILGAVFAIAASIAAVVVFSITQIRRNKWGSRKQVLTNWLLLLVPIVALPFAFPWAANLVIYQMIYAQIFVIIGVILAVVIGLYALVKGNDELALGILYGVVALIIAAVSIGISAIGTHWGICQESKPLKREAIVQTDPNKVRYTPHQVASTMMLNKFNSAAFTVGGEYSDPADINGGTGFVSPVVPDGLVSIWTRKMDGFIVFDDNPSAEQQIRRIDTPFEYGEGMLWTDNLERRLCAHDWMAVYPEIYYLQLDKDHPEQFTGVAPKMKYRYRFPFFMVPRWVGVVLIHQDGRLEDISVEEAEKDPRLKGKRLFPESFERQVIKSQIYERGMLGGLYRWEGKIRVPDMPGENQMPYFMQGADGESYWVTLAEPDGGSFALKRIYFRNAHTGELTYYEFSKETELVGPERAIQYVYALPNYKWVETVDGKEQGNFRVIEPVYCTRGNQLYYKYTVTTKEFATVVASAVVHPGTGQVFLFNNRGQLQEWLSGKIEVAPTIGGTANQSSESVAAPDVSSIDTMSTSELDQLEKHLLDALDLVRKMKAISEKN